MMKAKRRKENSSNHQKEVPPDNGVAPKTLRDQGISSQEMAELRKLNCVPDEQFEAAFEAL